MMLGPGIFGVVLAVLLLGGLYFYLHRSLTGATGEKLDEITAKIHTAEERLKDLIRYLNSYTSQAQHQAVLQMLTQTKADLENEKKVLKEIEGKLDVSQQTVEQKEGQQQEIKSAKEEDETKLQSIVDNYSQISQESIGLEQQLASSLKDLDKMLAELELTLDQKAVLEELAKALTSTGSLFRDLITEYAAVNERLDMLRQQHQDLEDEYTKLVEQQLGG